MPSKFDRNPHAKFSQVAIGLATKETDLNVPATLDYVIPVALDSIPQLDHRRETNKDQMTGKAEQDEVYNLGAKSKWDFNAGQVMLPVHAALLFAYGFGSVSTVAAGSTGYKHTITPAGGQEPPSFTCAFRAGENLSKIRLAGMVVDGIDLKVDRDSWAQLSGSLKGTGYYDDDVVKETCSANANATQIIISTAVLGDDVDNVHAVIGLGTSGQNLYAGDITGVSGTAISFSSLSDVLSTANNWTSIHRISTAWSTFPSRISEVPLHVKDMTLTIDGKWNGTSFLGGKAYDKEFKSFAYNLTKKTDPYFVPGSGDYAGVARSLEHEQTITLERDMIDELLSQHIINNDTTIGLHVLLEGSEYESGHNYTVELIIPAVGVSEYTRKADGKALTDSVKLPVLEGDAYASVIVNVKNKVSTLAA